MASDKLPGLYQDVYRTRFHGRRLYVKLQVLKNEVARVISFKEDLSL